MLIDYTSVNKSIICHIITSFTNFAVRCAILGHFITMLNLFSSGGA